jgi:hypothetical protein
MTSHVGMGFNPYVFESSGTQQSSNLSYSFIFSAAFHEFDNSISSLRRFIWLLPHPILGMLAPSNAWQGQDLCATGCQGN